MSAQAEARQLAALLAFLQRHQLTLVTAESCAGGLVSAKMAALPHSGSALTGGYVCYAPEVKHDCLGVNLETMRRHGLTSEAVAGEMALGALARSPARIAIANTGLADAPARGTPPVAPGTVCFAWALRTRDGPVLTTETRLFRGERNAVREAAAMHSLLAIAPWYREQARRHAL